jgi:hypothetical protein
MYVLTVFFLCFFWAEVFQESLPVADVKSRACAETTRAIPQLTKPVACAAADAAAAVEVVPIHRAELPSSAARRFVNSFAVDSVCEVLSLLRCSLDSWSFSIAMSFGALSGSLSRHVCSSFHFLVCGGACKSAHLLHFFVIHIHIHIYIDLEVLPSRLRVSMDSI